MRSLNMDTVQFINTRTLGHARAKRSNEVVPDGIGANHAMTVHQMSHSRNLTMTSQGHDAEFPFEVSVSIIGKIGSDEHSKTLKEKLGSNGIIIWAVITAEGHLTGTANTTLPENRKSSVVNDPKANFQLLPVDVENHWQTSGSNLVVVSLEIPPKTASAAVGLAKKNKVLVILNLTPEPELNVLDDNKLFDVDHLIMNDRDEDKILALSPMDHNARRKKSILQTRYSDAANRLHEKGASCVVITLGEMGALASYVVPEDEEGAGGQELWVFGAQVPVSPEGGSQKLKDETGALDAFVGAYAVEVLRQLHEEGATSQSFDISSALDMGIKAGGFSVGVEGGMEGCPWRDQIVGGRAFNAVEPFPRRGRVSGPR